MASLQELIAQKNALEKEIERTRQTDRTEAVTKIKAMMSEYGLTAADLSSKAAPKPRGGSGKKVAAKYRNTSTGDTWSGRGLQPKWLKAAIAGGKKISDFAV